MKSFKSIMIGTVFCLLVLLSAACGSSNSQEEGTANTSTGSQTATPTTTTDEKKDLGKVYVYNNTGVLSNESETSKKETVEAVRKFIKEGTGIEVHAIVPPKGSEKEHLNVTLSSNEKMDVFLGNMIDYQAKGAVMPINDLLDKYGDNIRKLWPAEWESAWGALTTADGKIWGIPNLPPLVGDTVLIREDWLKQLNIATPKTIEEFEYALQAIKDADPAGNGQTIPLLTDLTRLNLGLAAGWMEHGYNNFVDTDGKVKHPVLHSGYKEFVTKMKDWYEKGYIYKESFSTNRERQIELVKQNRVGAAAIWYTTVSNNMGQLWEVAPDAWYVVPELQGPKGNVSTARGVSTSGFMFNKNAQNPEAAMQYIDWLHSDLNNYMTVLYGVEGDNWKFTDKENGVYEELNTDYLGDLITATTFAYSVQLKRDTPEQRLTAEYISNNLTNLEKAKLPALIDYDYKFDATYIQNNYPNKSDVDRMVEEEVTKFITGIRPLSEYDQFIEELNKAGMQQMIEVYTAEYNRVK